MPELIIYQDLQRIGSTFETNIIYCCNSLDHQILGRNHGSRRLRREHGGRNRRAYDDNPKAIVVDIAEDDNEIIRSNDDNNADNDSDDDECDNDRVGRCDKERKSENTEELHSKLGRSDNCVDW